MKRRLQYMWYVLPFYLCGIFAALTGGCAARQSTIANLPPNVTQSQVQAWDSAVANLDTIAQTVTTLRQLTQSLCGATVTTSAGTSPVLSAGTCDLILANVGKIDQAEIAAARFLKTTPNTWGASTSSQIATYTGAITAALDELNRSGLTGIKNTIAQEQVHQFLVTIAGSVKIIAGL